MPQLPYEKHCCLFTNQLKSYKIKEWKDQVFCASKLVKMEDKKFSVSGGVCWWESDIRQLQGQRTSLCRKPWVETHNDDLTVCHSSNKVTKNNHTCTQTQKPKANTRDKFKEKCTKTAWHALIPDTNKHTHQCKKRNSADVNHSLHFHIISQHLADVLWNKNLDGGWTATARPSYIKFFSKQCSNIQYVFSPISYKQHFITFVLFCFLALTFG